MKQSNFIEKVQPNNSRSVKLGFLAAAITIAASICNGVASTQEATEPIWPTKEWQTSTPEEQGVDSRELAKVVDFGASRVLSSTGATPSSRLDSLLVVRHGKIVAEAYYAPYAAGILHQVNSVTKAVISTLTAIASKDGSLDSTSHRVLDFFDRGSIVSVDPINFHLRLCDALGIGRPFPSFAYFCSNSSACSAGTKN